MPTPAEQKALTFLAIVVLLGGAVRIVRGGVPSHAGATPADQQALARQADSASALARGSQGQGTKSKGKPSKAPKRRYAGAKFDSTGVLVEGSGVASSSLSPSGFPPPGPRIDIGGGESTPPGLDHKAGRRPIDLDVADTLQIASLPWVGPALARRIVANRDSQGPFRSLEALKRVKGVGPATLTRLGGLVTFSGQARR